MNVKNPEMGTRNREPLREPISVDEDATIGENDTLQYLEKTEDWIKKWEDMKEQF